MSVRLTLSSLDANQREQLKSDLIFAPQIKKFRGKQKWKFNPANKPSILGFRIEDDQINLPFQYGRQHFPDKIVPNNYCISSPIKFTGSLFDHQIPLVKRAWHQLQQTGSVILALHTGYGKTIVSAHLATYDPGLTLVLCESTILLKQWRETFSKFTDAKIWVVGEKVPEAANVIICMDTRFHKLPTNYLMMIKTIIIDEAHCFPTPTRYPVFLKLEPKYVIAATATPNRSDGLFAAIEAICSNHKISPTGCQENPLGNFYRESNMPQTRINYEKGITSQNKIVKISTKPFEVMKYETGIAVKIEQTKQGTPDWTKLVKDLCNHPNRNQLILEIVQMNLKQGFKILILTWREDHTRHLEKLIANIGISVDRMSGNKQSYHDSNVLVGTIGKIGKAFDEKSACDDFNGIRLDLLLLVGSMRSVELLEQVVGRVFRAEFPSIIHFCDDNKISKNHWNIASKWYKSRNGNISTCLSPYVINKTTQPNIKIHLLQQVDEFRQALPQQI